MSATERSSPTPAATRVAVRRLEAHFPLVLLAGALIAFCLATPSRGQGASEAWKETLRKLRERQSGRSLRPRASRPAVPQKKVRRALLLGGGGARGAFQVGMLQGLVMDKGLDFQVIRGISVGSLNAAFLAMARDVPGDPGRSLENMREQVRRLEQVWTGMTGNESVYSKKFPGKLGLAFSGNNSLYSLEPLTRLLEESVSVEALRASGRDFAVGTVCLVHGDTVYWTPDTDQFLLKLRASGAIPLLFPPTYLRDGEHVLVDGAVRDVAPVSRVCEREDVDEVYILLTSKMEGKGATLSSILPESFEKWSRAPAVDILHRSVDLLTDEVLLGDLRSVCERMANHARLLAELDSLGPAGSGTSRGASRDAGLREARLLIQKLTGFPAGRTLPRVYLLAPRVFYGKDNSAMSFRPEAIGEAMAHGRSIGMRSSTWVDMEAVLERDASR